MPRKKPEKVKAKSIKATRGARYQAAAAQIDKKQTYSMSEALELVKKLSFSNFDGSVDIHINLTPSKKTDENVRGTVHLPHGTGKNRRVVIITEDMIAKIAKGWSDFDVAIATPMMMPQLAKLARILGPKGLMPNPKSGTVTNQPEKVAEEMKGGRIEFKADTLGNIHQAIGKVSWSTEKLTENFQSLISALPKGRIRRITIVPTMGPGVKISL